ASQANATWFSHRRTVLPWWGGPPGPQPAPWPALGSLEYGGQRPAPGPACAPGGRPTTNHPAVGSLAVPRPMIAFLRGRLLEKRPNQLIMDVNGVGYNVQIPVSTFSQLPNRGSEAQLFVYTHVREDTLALYGFLTEKEKVLFEKLISVSGIGPRLAVTLLSGLDADELTSAIRRGDVQRLVRVPGVGRKTGERLVLELREKLGPLEAEPQAVSGPDEDVISALLNLGCSRPAAEAAVLKARQNGVAQEFEPLFRAALQIVMK